MISYEMTALRKAGFIAASFCNRFLTATKAIPKKLLR